MKSIILSFIALFSATYASFYNSISAQTTFPTLKEIMTGQKFVGSWPEQASWNAQGTGFTFDWNEGNKYPLKVPYLYDLKLKKVSELASEADFIPFDRNQANYSRQYYSSGNKLCWIDKSTNIRGVIMENNAGFSDIQRLQSPDIIAFSWNGNLHSYNAKTGLIKQLTNFVAGEEPPQNSETRSYLQFQEAMLFEFHKIKKTESDFRKERKSKKKLGLSPIYLGFNSLYNATISSSGDFVIFTTLKSVSDKSTNVMNFMDPKGDAKTFEARSKVSENNPSMQLFVYDLLKDTTIKVDLNQLEGILKAPNYLKKTADLTLPRAVSIQGVTFAPNQKNGLLEFKSYDNKDRWICVLEPNSGKLSTINHQKDDAWIGGPSIGSWNEEAGEIGWIDSTTIYYCSEKTGWSQLYSYSFKSKIETALTTGNWEIHSVSKSKNPDILYITANKSKLGNRSFYHLNLKNNTLTPILEKDGNYEVAISPDEKILAIRYSEKTKPWEIFTASNAINTVITQITYSQSAEFKAQKWIDPTIISYKGLDGVPVFARIYEPEAAVKNGAAVIFVHGAGYLQNAHNWWSHYYREYLFHNLLAREGYTVLDIDYRASEGYGRNHRTGIYQFMGGKDLDDHLAGKSLLISNYSIDPKRVGIYGGSYGGFITLMALLTKPDEFACGAALRSVTDWAHYNHEYTQNILNSPETDSIAYQKSSPIYFAQNLKKPLLMLHGMVDDNVQFQDVVRLSQRFIELGKTNWELATYPVEAHAFNEASSWHDEYRRIYELFNLHLLKKIPK